jgi:hypothetical protein
MERAYFRAPTAELARRSPARRLRSVEADPTDDKRAKRHDHSAWMTLCSADITP